MYGKGEVLMHADIGPPNAVGVGVRRFVWHEERCAFHRPLGIVPAELDGRHQLTLSGIPELPATHVMAARYHARFDSFRNPRFDDEISALRCYANEIATLNRKSLCVLRMNPKRIDVRELIEPLGVCAARVNLRR